MERRCWPRELGTWARIEGRRMGWRGGTRELGAWVCLEGRRMERRDEPRELGTRCAYRAGGWSGGMGLESLAPGAQEDGVEGRPRELGIWCA
ncbi:hypothetical protein NDU88_006174 [Pleurodeles waltl]|uniref:Uncharacterized protein n=1 Tax=Pleurodeles waltl TaxID=8319 RepID=A0AAV7L6X2_PLEWA|nr:hypothetical protein NDU88_006167 [Pleurodeles waltl]KAJ1086044.1 hypothetical protein NDU88_006168 [Pleurodeles waltl]KAJ1086050.1 hypothetical protein NDU88_006174 [Pleurodeles waltl]